MYSQTKFFEFPELLCDRLKGCFKAEKIILRTSLTHNLITVLFEISLFMLQFRPAQAKGMCELFFFSDYAATQSFVTF